MMKIIQLESVSFMDQNENQNNGSFFSETRVIAIGHPYGEPWFGLVHNRVEQRIEHVERHSERDVSLIEYEESNPEFFVVRLKNGHIIKLPSRMFIAEMIEENEGEP